ncbi:MAG: isoleucine--tRNA ligase [Patescibacteria group bacterium]
MPGIDFPKMEEDVLARWERDGIFKKTLQKPAPQGNFVFYEGPPTANGKPGIHHVEARAYKDVIPRYKTMRGFHVERKAGWDTHGLPVELEVEKKLGISGKPQIEKLKPTVTASIAYFNALCKESVWTYLEDWKRLTKRIGFWVDLEHPYVTYEPAYIESLWAMIRQIWDRGLMVEDDKIVPYCPRCGTALSSHEVAQGYKEVRDPSVYVRFKTKDGAAFLVWTTTPWTLPANVALAVGPAIIYVEVKLGGERLILAKSRLMILAGQEYAVLRELAGADLVGMAYEPLYALATPDAPAHRVVAGDFVSTEDGTGIVHIAPAFGEDDLRVARENALPMLRTVNAEGQFAFATEDPFGMQLNGMFVKDGDALISEDLKKRGLLWRVEPYVHEYPFCWRCSTPLLYYAKRSWFFAVSKVKAELIANAERITWTPSYIKEGRFGEWLNGVRDWAISRERYWGTPIPVWTCAVCGIKECIGSFAELRSRATEASRPKEEGFDPHRPFIDAVELVCACGGTMGRIPDVMDVWFDSGAMPFAQWHYPFEGKEKVDPSTSSGQAAAYPADYIAEAIDQTRGWFYTLLATATLLGRGTPYKNVVCLGHILDAKGQKMSKSKGNIVSPFEMIDRYGADACRFYMYTVNQPGDPKRFDEADLDKVVKKTLNILWNVLTFWETYRPQTAAKAAPSSHVLDRWIMSRLNRLTDDVTADLEALRITEAGRALAAFVDDLSTWYIRRSRDRIKGPDGAAAATLQLVLATFARLAAPFLPFIAESVYARVDGGKDSVHLEDWPEPGAVDDALLAEMDHARRIVSFGLEERANVKVPIRQPLAAAKIKAKPVADEFVALIRDELNVLTVTFAKPLGDSIVVKLDTQMTPELKLQGALRELIRHVQNLRKNAKLTVQDRITLSIMGADDELLAAMRAHHDELKAAFRADLIREEKAPDVLADAQIQIGESAFWIGITKV